MPPDQIMGTYDLEKKVEDTVILLDLTRANYGDANRAVIIEESIQELIENKVGLSAAHRFALIGFGETTEILLDFADWGGPQTLMDALYGKAKILGEEANFFKALSAGFQVTISSMQKMAEGKVFRILFLSEGRFMKDKQDWNELADKASKIGLFVDAVKIGVNDDTTLKRISRATSGDYVECNLKDLKSWLPSFAAVKKQSNANQTDADKNLKGLLEIIAAPLISIRDNVKKPGDLLKLAAAKDASSKCGICYSPDCMICKGPAFACGAFCPNCNRFFHVHCAAAWAENSKDTPNNVFKCPVCFSLLKVPGELYRVKVLQGRLKDSFHSPKEKLEMDKLKAKDLGMGWETFTCAKCYGIFESPDSEVMRCGNKECRALYHSKCLDKVEEKNQGRCRVCDSPFRRKFDAARGIQRIV
jgi:hypothetical protein